MSDQNAASSVAFVRTEQVPPAPPPFSTSGPVKWARDNLFSTPFYTVLTILAVYFIYVVLANTLPWILNGVWAASSLAECREVLDGVSGGCFAVLAFILLFVDAARVLFYKLPRQLLIITGLSPFVAYYLIWGGTIWTPILALAGVMVGYLVYARQVSGSFAAGFFGGIAAAFVVWIIGGMLIPQDANEAAVMQAIPSRDLGGFMLNMMLGVTCVSLSLPLGIALALGRQSNMPLIKWICVIFIEFIRGVPLITLLFVASVMLAYFFPPETTTDLFLRVVIMITMFSAAYIAEVIRGGLAALPRGQYEAADSLGLDYAQAMRLIILPQALKISIPGIVNVAVGLFKDTTLVSVISMFDLVGMIRGPILASTEWNGVYWELLGFAALLFFVVCYGISQYSQWLERQLATDHR